MAPSGAALLVFLITTVWVRIRSSDPSCNETGCELGHVCVEAHHRMQCVPGCYTPFGDYLQPGEDRWNDETFCSCKELVQTGGGVLDCKCMLPLGELFSPGQTIIDTCWSCTCEEENMTAECTSVECVHPPPCVDPIITESLCCPVCEACRTPFDTCPYLVPGQEIRQGNTICYCQREDDETEQITEAFCTTLGCDVPNDGFISPGDTYSDPCVFCICEETSESVSMNCIPRAECMLAPCSHPVSLDNECCPRCDVCRTPSGKYLAAGQEVTEGNKLCTCIRPNDESGIVEATCRPTKCMVPRGEMISPGETYSEPCWFCICDGATMTLTCLHEECLPLSCDNPVVVDGECCHRCDEKPGLCPSLLREPRVDVEVDDCFNECDYDEDCDGQLKCCRRGDCRICTAPVFHSLD